MLVKNKAGSNFFFCDCEGILFSWCRNRNVEFVARYRDWYGVLTAWCTEREEVLTAESREWEEELVDLVVTRVMAGTLGRVRIARWKNWRCL